MIAGALALQLFAACSDDDTTQEMQTVTMTIPIEVYSSNNEVTSRAASQGDPGNDVVFEQPLYLYVYACVYEKDGSSSSYELLTETIKPASSGEDDSKTKWTLMGEDTENERWTKNVDVTFKITKEFDGTDNSKVSRVYAIASREDLGSDGKNLLPTTYNSTTDKSTVEKMTLNLSGFTSAQLKDIYSTPLGDDNNGVITSTTNSSSSSSSSSGTTSSNVTLTCSTVRLYHVAAKVDFTWEVASTLQSTTELASITCTGLPTTCKVFEPTENPTTNTADVLLLGTSSSTPTPVNEVNAGNKWLGRAYAFMLQPPSTGTINYTVKFGPAGSTTKKGDVTGTITPDQTTYSKVFTGWYRIVATVE